MTQRSRLPDDLAETPFRSRDVSPGRIPRSRLRAADLNQEVRGTRLAAADLTFEQRCALFQLRMPPNSFFSHGTAARLLGVPLPWQLESSPLMHIAVPGPARAPHAAGIAGHKLVVGAGDILTLPSGLRVTTPSRTWLDLGAILKLHDLVAAGDFVIHWRHPLASIGQLATGLKTRRSRRGLATLYAALELLSDRSESPPESVLRVLVIFAGLPAPRVNHEVADGFGEFVARTDLIIDECRLVLEYMGDYHRTSKNQWRADMTRRSRLEAQGWRVIELNADDLNDPGELIERIRMHAALSRSQNVTLAP